MGKNFFDANLLVGLPRSFLIDSSLDSPQFISSMYKRLNYKDSPSYSRNVHFCDQILCPENSEKDLENRFKMKKKRFCVLQICG